MANKPFDSRVYNTLEQPASTDWNIAQAQQYRTLMELLQSAMRIRTETGGEAAAAVNIFPFSGFVADGFRVRATDPALMAVLVTRGMGVLYAPSDTPSGIAPPIGPGASGISDLCTLKPIFLTSDITFLVPANPGAARFDIVEARVDRHFADSQNVGVFDTGIKQFVVQPVDKTFSLGELDTQSGINLNAAVDSTAGLSYKIGVPGAGVPPATSTGYTRIAVIKTPAAAVSVAQTAIADHRTLLPDLGSGGVVRIGATAEVSDVGSLIPTNLHLYAPPGVRCVANVKPDQLLLPMQFWFFGVVGDAATQFRRRGICSVRSTGQSASAFPACYITDMSVGVLTQADIDVLNGGTFAAEQSFPTAAAAGLAVGETYIKVAVAAARLTVAAGALLVEPHAGFSNPHYIDVEVTLIRAETST